MQNYQNSEDFDVVDIGAQLKKLRGHYNRVKKEQRKQPLMEIISSKKTDLSAAFAQVQKGFESGMIAKLTDEGTSGSYVMSD
jgi:hypothetical protein